MNVKAAFASNIQTFSPLRVNANPQTTRARQREVLSSFKAAVALEMDEILPSLSANGVSVLTRKSGLLLSYRCFALKLSPGGYGAARLCTDFPLSSQGRSRTVDLFSCVAPPPERD